MTEFRDSPDQPLVTIGVAVYNGGEDLEIALESLVAQDYPNLEIVICDDGSTDGSLERCVALADRNENWHVTRNPSQLGIVGNYNQLISLAHGKYLVLSDQDDRREPTFVSRCVEVLESDPDAVLCHSHTGVVWPGIRGDLYHVNTLDSVDGITPVVRRYWRFLRHYSDTAVYGLIRVDALRHTHGWQQGLGSANRILFDLLLIGTFRQVPETLYWYTATGLRARPIPEEEFARQSGGRQLPRMYIPFLALAWAQAKGIIRSRRTSAEKVQLIAVLWAHVAVLNTAKAIFRMLSWLMRGHVPTTIRRYCADLVYSTADLRFMIRPEDDHNYYPDGWPLHRS